MNPTTSTITNHTDNPATVAAQLLAQVAEGGIGSLEELEDKLLDVDCLLSDQVACLIGDVLTDEDTFHLVRIRHQGLSCTLADLSAAYSTTPERWWAQDLDVPDPSTKEQEAEIHIDWCEESATWSITSLSSSSTTIDQSWAPSDDAEALDLYRALMGDEDQFGEDFLI